MKTLVGGIIGILLVLAVFVGGMYNSLVGKTTAIEGQWAQVETQYQRRYDLIPNLVASTKGVLEQEQEVFGMIAEARTRYAGASSVNEKAQAATELESALGRLLVIMENYPQLRSSETVARLMDELAGTENRINVERRRFNELVQNYNTVIRRIPTNAIASMFGFEERAYFEASEGSDDAPKVEL